MEWHVAQEKMKAYLLQIETQDGFGTGFLFAYNNDKSIAAIATAAHVVQQAYDWRQPIKLIHFDTGDQTFLSADDRVIFVDRKRDSASILIKSDKLNLPKNLLPLMDHTKHKKVGLEVAWTGFPSVAYPNLCFFSGCVSAFLTASDCYLIDGVAINGVSGGPVYAELEDGKHTPQIIGSISAYMANRVSGDTLPGLLRAQDISPFQEAIKKIKNLDEARKKEEEAAKKNAESGVNQMPPPEPKK